MALHYFPSIFNYKLKGSSNLPESESTISKNKVQISIGKCLKLKDNDLVINHP